MNHRHLMSCVQFQIFRSISLMIFQSVPDYTYYQIRAMCTRPSVPGHRVAEARGWRYTIFSYQASYKLLYT